MPCWNGLRQSNGGRSRTQQINATQRPRTSRSDLLRHNNSTSTNGPIVVTQRRVDLRFYAVDFQQQQQQQQTRAPIT